MTSMKPTFSHLLVPKITGSQIFPSPLIRKCLMKNIVAPACTKTLVLSLPEVTQHLVMYITHNWSVTYITQGVMHYICNDSTYISRITYLFWHNCFWLAFQTLASAACVTKQLDQEMCKYECQSGM